MLMRKREEEKGREHGSRASGHPTTKSISSLREGRGGNRVDEENKDDPIASLQIGLFRSREGRGEGRA